MQVESPTNVVSHVPKLVMPPVVSPSKKEIQKLEPAKSLNEVSKSLLSQKSVSFTNYFSKAETSQNQSSSSNVVKSSLISSLGIRPSANVTTKRKWGKK